MLCHFFSLGLHRRAQPTCTRIFLGKLQLKGSKGHTHKEHRFLNVREDNRWIQLGQKSRRTKVSPNFSNFRPEFCHEYCSEFSPNFLRSFRGSFRGKRRPEKIHQKSPPFFNAKFPGKCEKNIHKILLERRRSKIHTLGWISGDVLVPWKGSVLTREPFQWIHLSSKFWICLSSRFWIQWKIRA